MHTQVGKILIALILSCAFECAANAQERSDRARDDLIGPVKSVLLETILIECQSGKLVEVHRLDPIEEYDANGTLKGNRNRFIIDDPISRMFVYPFDERIPVIVKPTYWEDGVPPGWKYGALIYTDVYTYDNQARRSESVHYGPTGTFGGRLIVTFDEHGRIAETKMYNDNGELADWNIITRDSRGNVLESASYKEDGTLVEVQNGGNSYLNRFVFTYEFDSIGNWISQETSKPVLKDGQPVLEPFVVRHRTITYY